MISNAQCPKNADKSEALILNIHLTPSVLYDPHAFTSLSELDSNRNQ